MDKPDARDAGGMIKNPERYWPFIANKVLAGRTIKRVRWMGKQEAEDRGWARAVILILDNGVELVAQQDDEGNGAGAIEVVGTDELYILPVL